MDPNEDMTIYFHYYIENRKLDFDEIELISSEISLIDIENPGTNMIVDMLTSQVIVYDFDYNNITIESGGLEIGKNYMLTVPQ